MSRSVQFSEIAVHLNEDAKVDSNLRRIQAFFSDYQMSYQQIAIILISFIPNKKYRLCIDRTNWKFGSKDINIFTLTIYYKGTSVPILFEMLEKRGDELLKIYGKSFLRDIIIQGMVLHLAMDFSKNKNGDDDPLLVLTNDRNSNALKIYRERWSIEVFLDTD